MRKLGLLVALCAGAAFAQGQSSTTFQGPLTVQGSGGQCTINTIAGPIASVNCGGAPAYSLIGATTGNMSLFIDHAQGSDSNACTSPGAGACKTFQGACNLLPNYIKNTVTITAAAGTYPEGGCYLQGLTIEPGASGAYIDIEGTLIDAADAGGPGCPATGTITGATQQSNNNFATATIGTNCWTDGGLRQYLLEVDPQAGGNPNILAVYDNTGTVVTLAGSWPTTPTNGDTFHVRDWGTIIDGGLTLPGNAASVHVPGTNSNAVTNETAFIISNSHGGAQAPLSSALTASTGSTSSSGQIILSKLKATGLLAGMTVARNADDVLVRYSSATGYLTNSSLESFVASDGKRVSLIANYMNGTGAVGGGASQGNAALFAPDPSVYLRATLVGNVVDVASLVLESSQPYGGAFLGVGPLSLITLANSTRNSAWSSIGIDNLGTSFLNDDKVETTSISGSACLKLGISTDLGVGGFWQGSAQINGGVYGGCNSNGIVLGTGSWQFRGGAANVCSGTGNALWGVLVTPGAEVEVNASGSVTLTGTSGDFSLDNVNAQTWANATSVGRITNVGLRNSVSEGTSTVGGSMMGSGNYMPYSSGAGEVGDWSTPLLFGAGNFVQVDAGTGNFQTLNVGGVAIDSSPDLFLQFDDPVTVIGNTSDFQTWGPSQHAMTLKTCTCSVAALGGGTGTETWKVTSGAGGTGTAFMTVVVPCNAAAGANCTSCTVNTAAVPTNTTFHAAVTTACTTADVTSRIQVSATEP